MGGGWGKGQGVWGLGGGQSSVDTQRTGLLHHLLLLQCNGGDQKIANSGYKAVHKTIKGGARESITKPP